MTDISIEGVDKLLQGLSPNKASGPDEISPKILKELHHEIAPILTLIFNLSLETGGQFHDERDKVKINKYVYFHCKLIALTQTVLCVGKKHFYTTVKPALAATRP